MSFFLVSDLFGLGVLSLGRWFWFFMFYFFLLLKIVPWVRRRVMSILFLVLWQSEEKPGA